MSRIVRCTAALAATLMTPLLFAGESATAPAAAPATTSAAKPAPKAEAGKSTSEEKRCPYSTQECLSMMASRMKAGGWIGIEYEPADPDGPKITRVVPGSPAEKAGMQPGDILFALNGVELRNENEEALEKARKGWKPGQTVHYTVKRDGVEKGVDVVLGEWPADLLARYIGEHMLQHAKWDAEDAARKQANPK